MREARISINGVQLTDAQSMTIRVAVQCFAQDLSVNGLGEDEHGKTMVGLYQQRIAEINRAIRAGCERSL